MRIELMTACVLLGSFAAAQTPTTSDVPLAPPPLVTAPPPPPMPTPEPIPSSTPPSVRPAPGTPPPPTSVPPNYGSQSAYQYSPYGTPQLANTKPGPEVGLMVSESLFGMLTASGTFLLPYFLVNATTGGLSGGTGLFDQDSTVGTIILIGLAAAVPLSVTQTQISIANGSRFYISESWPNSLAGLGASAAVMGLFYATGWLGTPTISGGVPKSGSRPLLLIGMSAFVPLVQMAITNLTKQPKFQVSASNDIKPGHGLTLTMPAPMPVLTQSATGGTTVGLGVSVLNGRF
jgi:hypothetical protein